MTSSAVWAAVLAVVLLLIVVRRRDGFTPPSQAPRAPLAPRTPPAYKIEVSLTGARTYSTTLTCKATDAGKVLSTVDDMSYESMGIYTDIRKPNMAMAWARYTAYLVCAALHARSRPQDREYINYRFAEWHRIRELNARKWKIQTVVKVTPV
jgi:hypothetical protein